MRELLAVLLGISHFLPLLKNNVVALFADNTTAISYLKKSGGTKLESLNETAQSILRLCEENQISLLPQFVAGALNSIADSLSRANQVLGSEWTLVQEVVRDLLRRWSANIDLFATRLNHRLPVYFSPVKDPMALGTDAMIQSWDNLQAYAFPPFGLIQSVIQKLRQSNNTELTLIAPFWPQKCWFPDLLELLVEVPISLPLRADLLRQPHFHRFHKNLHVLQLAAWRISSNPPNSSVSLQRWRDKLLFVDENQLA